MRFFAAVVVVTGLCACPPVEPECRRNSLPGVDGGDTRLAIVGQPLVLSTTAPLTSCADDSLRARVDLLGPDNLSRPAPEVTPVRAEDGTVFVTFSVTVDQLGPWLAHVTFEPSLGVRSLSFEGVESRLAPQGPSVSLAGCLGEPWPVSADTIACSRSVTDIEVRSPTGVIASFTGERLVVADDALWSIDGTAFALERRVVDDAGVHLTHRFDGFKPTALAGLHRRDSALRTTTSGFLAIARADGGVEVSSRLASQFSEYTLFFDEPQGIVHGPACNHDEPFCIDALVGLEEDVVWINEGRGVRALRRPVTQTGGSLTAFSLPFAPEGFPAASLGGFSRLPLLLYGAPGEQLLLATPRDGGFVLSVWPRNRVLRFGLRFATVLDPDDPSRAQVVRLTP